MLEKVPDNSLLSSQKKFLDSARSVQAETSSFILRNNNLKVHIASYGRLDAKKILLCTSGLHGVEGHAGSMIQSHLLTTIPKMDIPKDTTLLFIHVLNPYGLSWNRRTNENNVDLNRNYSLNPKELAPSSELYKQVNLFLNPKEKKSLSFFSLKIIWNIIKKGYSPLKEAITKGQSIYPEGLFFKGLSIEENLYQYKKWLVDNISHAENIFSIDIHTGLGQYGKETIFSFSNNKSHFPKKTLVSGDGPGFNKEGGLENLYHDLYKKIKWVHFTQEFGTYNNIKMLKELRKENYYYHTNQKEVSQTILKKVFFPDDPKWKTRVLSQAEETYVMALNTLKIMT